MTRALTFLVLWIATSIAVITGLVTAARALADYDPACYQRCQREACKDACSDERLKERPEDCKACGKHYDRVCLEQCRGTKPPPVGGKP